MNDFGMYLEIGFRHIANWSAIDHILFIVALCIRYQFADWRKLLILVTAFTIGHSVTLALSVFDLINYSVRWIEFLIPVTIVIKKFTFKSKFPLIYFMALFFGLIHGLGFSNYLKGMMGKGESIFWQLLAFNIGLEAGQILIVSGILFITLIFVSLFKVSRREYLLYVSAVAFALALEMAIERFPLPL